MANLFKFNNRSKKNAFTLTELLSVILILGVLILILVPIVTSITDLSKRNAFENSVYHAMSTIQENIAIEDFVEYPKEGYLAKDLEELEKNPFIAGKFVFLNKKIQASNVTNGIYCASGPKEKLKIVKGECYLLDETPPNILTVNPGTITSKSIAVIVEAEDLETEIVSYEYSIDNGNTYDKTSSNTYTFKDLTHDKAHTITVRVTNEAGFQSTKKATLSTLKIDKPEFTSNPALTEVSKYKDVTINYPTRQTDWVYEYSQDMGASWIVVTGTTKTLRYTQNGTIIARITDGYNKVLADTLTITTIDSTAPSVPTSIIRLNSSTGSIRTNTAAWTNSDLWWGSFSSSDTGGSGIDHYEYSNNCSGTKTGNLVSSYIYSTSQNMTKCIRAVDKAGNTSVWSSQIYFNIDKIAPTCTTTGGSSTWSTSSVGITGTCSDTGGSGCNSSYSTVSKSLTNVNGSYSPGTVRDNAGNTKACSTVLVKTDNTAPYAPYISSFKLNTAGSSISYQSCSLPTSSTSTAAITCNFTFRAPVGSTFTWDTFTGNNDNVSGVAKDQVTFVSNGTGGDRCTTWADNWCGVGNVGTNATTVTVQIRSIDNAGNVGPITKWVITLVRY